LAFADLSDEITRLVSSPNNSNNQSKISETAEKQLAEELKSSSGDTGCYFPI